MVRLSRQQLLIYLLLKNAQPGEIHIDQITERSEMNVRGYTERISELRKKQFEVVNTRPCHYTLKSEPAPTIDFLKQVYVGAKKFGYSQLMYRCVEKAHELHFASDVKEALL